MPNLMARYQVSAAMSTRKIALPTFTFLEALNIFAECQFM
jgi:hypothetical protein